MTKPDRINIFIIISAVIFLLSPILFSRTLYHNFGDVYRYYYPFKNFAVETLTLGAVPLWNPYIFSGMPFLASPQNAVFYPLSTPTYFFKVVPGMNWSVLLYLLYGSVFIYLFLRKYFKLSSTALLGALLFAYLPFNILKITAGHPAFLAGIMSFPAVLLFIHDLLNRKRLNWFMVGLSALAISFMFLSGHTQAYYILMILLVLFVLAVKPSHLLWLIPPILLSFIITAPQLLPTLEFAFISQRADAGIWDYSSIVSYSLPLKNLLLFLNPNIFHSVGIHGTINLPYPSDFFELQCLWMGTLPLILAAGATVIGLKTRKYSIIVWVIIVFIGIFLAMGAFNPVNKYLYKILPGLTYFRAPGRFIFLSLFALIMLALYGWEYSCQYFSTQVKNKWYGVFVLYFITVMAARLFFWNTHFIHSGDNVYSNPSAYAKDMQSLNTTGCYRIYTAPEVGNHNKAMLYHLYNTNGCEVIIPKNYVRYTSSLGARWTTIDTDFYNAEQKLLSILAVKWSLIENGSTGIKLYETPMVEPMFYYSQTGNSQRYIPKILQPEPNTYILSNFICPPGSVCTLKMSGTNLSGWYVIHRNKYFKATDTGDYGSEYTATLSGDKEETIVLKYKPVMFTIGTVLGILTILSGCWLILIFL
ncbi:MAG: hypothetical protein WC955_05670 [Elusimicrobiota bacterium]